MSVYARSDLVAVYVSQAHGGCATGRHTRPVVNGAPAQVWRLDCPDCENYLRSDPLWSSTVSEVPETFDETRSREDFEKRGAKDKDAIMTLAIARLAGVDPGQLPESLTRMISGAKAHLPQDIACPAGHPNPLDQKFCGECGLPVTGLSSLPPPSPADVLPAGTLAPSAAAQSAAPPEAPQKAATVSLPSNTRMRGMKREELAELAAGANLDTSGTRAELLERLIAANNNGKAVTPQL